MSFSKNKIPYFSATILLLSLIIIPPLLSRKPNTQTINQTQPSPCLWKNPHPENCPDSLWEVKKDPQGCPYLFCPSQKKVLSQKKELKNVRLSVDKETFTIGETVSIQMKNISGRRINLSEQIFWEIKKVTSVGEQIIFSQTTPTANFTNFERNQVFKFSWDQKDKWGRPTPPAKYLFKTKVEDQTYTLNFNIS